MESSFGLITELKSRSNKFWELYNKAPEWEKQVKSNVLAKEFYEMIDRCYDIALKIHKGENQ